MGGWELDVELKGELSRVSYYGAIYPRYFYRNHCVDNVWPQLARSPGTSPLRQDAAGLSAA